MGDVHETRGQAALGASVAKPGLLEMICNEIGRSNSRLSEVQDLLGSGFNRIMGPVPPKPTQAEPVSEVMEDSAISTIQSRLQTLDRLLRNVEGEAARLAELG